MQKKPNKISFDMETDEIEFNAQVLLVNKAFYTKKICKVAGSLRFPIPTEITTDLNLSSSDLCYFIEYSEGYYIAFKIKPEDIPLKRQYRHRKLIKAGMYDTLFVAIPQFIKNKYTSEITYIQLIRPKGFKENEWQIQFFTDSI